MWSSRSKEQLFAHLSSIYSARQQGQATLLGAPHKAYCVAAMILQTMRE